MDELKKHQNSLLVILLLIVVKFIFMPIIEWQNDVLNHVALQEKKLAKVERLIVNTELMKNALSKLHAESSVVHGFFYQDQDINTLQRAIQKDIEAKLKSNNIRINSAGWKKEVKKEGSEIVSMKLDLRVQGAADQLTAFFIAYQTMNTKFNISQLNMIFNSNKVHKNGRASANFSFEFFNVKNQVSSGGTDA